MYVTVVETEEKGLELVIRKGETTIRESYISCKTIDEMLQACIDAYHYEGADKTEIIKHLIKKIRLNKEERKELRSFIKEL